MQLLIDSFQFLVKEQKIWLACLSICVRLVTGARLPNEISARTPSYRTPWLSLMTETQLFRSTVRTITWAGCQKEFLRSFQSQAKCFCLTSAYIEAVTGETALTR